MGDGGAGRGETDVRAGAFPRSPDAWSPLALGLMALVCNPFFIPTLMAITRGMRELGWVRRRQGAGYFSEEHARIRTGAVWGMALACSHLGATAVLLLAALVSSLLGTGELPPVAGAQFGADELTELRERLRSEDEGARTMAMRHLLAVGPSLESAEVQALIEDAGAREPVLASVMLRAAASTREPIVGLSSGHVRGLDALYRRLDPPGRTAALELLARIASEDRADAFEVLLELARGERSTDARVRLPVDTLAAIGLTWPQRVARLWTIDDGSPLAPDVMEVVGQYCQEVREHSEEEPDAAVYRPGLERAALRWQALRDPLRAPPEQPGLAGLLAPDRRRMADEAAAALAVLGCDAPDHLASAEEALESADPRVVLAGMRMLRTHGRPVPGEVQLGLAEEPLTRAGLYAMLRQELDDEHAHVQLPGYVFTDAALAESRVVTHAARVERDFVAPEVRARGRVPFRAEEAFYVFELAGLRAAGEEARFVGVSGPYSRSVGSGAWAGEEVLLLAGEREQEAVRLAIEEVFDDRSDGP